MMKVSSEPGRCARRGSRSMSTDRILYRSKTMSRNGLSGARGEASGVRVRDDEYAPFPKNDAVRVRVRVTRFVAASREAELARESRRKGGG